MNEILARMGRAVRNAWPGAGWGWLNPVSTSGWTFGGVTSNAGKTVTARTSLEISAVWDCVRKTAEMVSTLPLDLFEKTAEGGKRELENDLSSILTIQPNQTQTAVEFWEGLVAQTVLQGNGYAEKLYIGSRLVGLRPLFDVTVQARPEGGLRYFVLDRGKRVEIPDDRMFHLRGFGSGDGLGMSAIRYGANSIGAALAADETAGKVFSNAMMASGIVQTEKTLSAEQRDYLRKLLDEYVGSRRAGKVLTLEAGLDWKQLQMNPEDAQLLETRRYQVEDVCRWFGVPPIVIGHSAEGQTMWGSGIEQILLSWRTLGINPLLRRIEARVRRDLIPVDRRARWFIEFNREAMLQMDSKAKGDFLLKMRMGGFMSGDEGRDKLNLPRRGGASDDLVVQTSMQPIDLLGKDEE